MIAFRDMILQLRQQSCRYGTNSLEAQLRADVAALERRYQQKMLKQRNRRTCHFALLSLLNRPR